MLFTPTVLSPTSSAATSTCNPAGQRRTRARQRRRSAARAGASGGGNTAGQTCVRARVASDFNPVSISCGYRVSCADALLEDRVSRQVGGVSWRDQRAPAASLISSKNL